MRRLWSCLAPAALALSLLAGCGIWGMEGGPGGAGAALAPNAPSAAPAVTAVPGSDGVQRIAVEAGDDLRFHPSVVRAKVGTIEFTFRNTGLTPHDVRVEAGAPVDTGNVNGGDSTTVRITVPEPGTYPFPCVYHSSSGMVGTLIVS